MRNLLLIIVVSFLYSCQLHTKTPEVKQLEERITRLEQMVDSITKVSNATTDSLQRMGATLSPNYCAALTKKGTPCKRKAGSNGYCWQHKK